MGARKKPKTEDFKIMNATEAKNHFGRLLDDSRQSPVKIEKNGRAFAVVLSIEEFQRFQEIEDALLVQQANIALKEGTLGKTKSEAKLAKWLSK